MLWNKEIRLFQTITSLTSFFQGLSQWEEDVDRIFKVSTFESAFIILKTF